MKDWLRVVGTGAARKRSSYTYNIINYSDELVHNNVSHEVHAHALPDSGPSGHLHQSSAILAKLFLVMAVRTNGILLV